MARIAKHLARKCKVLGSILSTANEKKKLGHKICLFSALLHVVKLLFTVIVTVILSGSEGSRLCLA